MFKKIFGVLCVTLAVVSCGGGGGGGGNSSDDQAPADLNVSADPTSIDSGDRIAVRVRIDDLQVNEIALKVKFPKQLRYIRSSAYLTVEDSDDRFDPTDVDTAGSSSYLVFYLTNVDLGDNEEGIISFELVGDSLVEDGLIEVDADIDDPDLANSSEFDPTDPKFDAQDSVTVQVRGEPEPTPTPSPAPTVAATATATS